MSIIDDPRKFQVYAEVAMAMAKLSRSTKRQVAAVAFFHGRTVASGINGTPPGFANDCEDTNGETRPEVIHAEANLVAYAARHGLSLFNTSILCTLEPCIECAKLLASAGVAEVIYLERHTSPRGSGVALLNKLNINCKFV